MKTALLFLLTILVGVAIWGCWPSRYIPEPMPPVPSPPPPRVMYYEEVLRFRGQAPPVGPRVEQRRMLA